MIPRLRRGVTDPEKSVVGRDRGDDREQSKKKKTGAKLCRPRHEQRSTDDRHRNNKKPDDGDERCRLAASLKELSPNQTGRDRITKEHGPGFDFPICLKLREVGKRAERGDTAQQTSPFPLSAKNAHEKRRAKQRGKQRGIENQRLHPGDVNEKHRDQTEHARLRDKQPGQSDRKNDEHSPQSVTTDPSSVGQKSEVEPGERGQD